MRSGIELSQFLRVFLPTLECVYNIEVSQTNTCPLSVFTSFKALLFEILTSLNVI